MFKPNIRRSLTNLTRQRFSFLADEKRKLYIHIYVTNRRVHKCDMHIVNSKWLKRNGEGGLETLEAYKPNG